jgi:hypothetical protein
MMLGLHNRLPLVLLFLTAAPVVATGQTRQGSPKKSQKVSAPVSKEAPQHADNGPSTEQTAQWISQELPPLARYVYSEIDRGWPTPARTLNWARVDSAAYVNCTLSLLKSRGYRLDVAGAPAHSDSSSSVTVIPLRLLNLSGFVINDVPIIGSQTSRTGAARQLRIPLRADAGKAIITDNSRGQHFDESFENLPVSDDASGTRIMNALRRAATLCGASASAF